MSAEPGACGGHLVGLCCLRKGDTTLQHQWHRAVFRRVALTRAKARALRDALGIDLVAVEELADE